MTPQTSDADHWRRIGGILERALELPSAERTAYVEKACDGDEADRAEVESLLAAAKASAWLDQPAYARDPQDPSAAFSPLLPSPLPVAGTMLGPYRLTEKIGAGGMGVVFRAVDTRLDREVALKIISHEEGAAGREQARFLREARMASALNHPNIVIVYEYGSAGRHDYIAMELIEGRTLRELLEAGDVPLETLLGYMWQVAEGAARAHGADIVHRDLKPRNIMVTADGTAKILDFGLAKRSESIAPGPDDATQTELTRAGSVVGTPTYMSPEQTLGAAVDFRTDIFSFGIMLYEIVEGRPPFRGANSWEILHQIVSVDPPPLTGGSRSIPRGLTELIAECLKKKPEERLDSMASVAERLKDVLLPADRTKTEAGFSRRYVVAAGLAMAAATGVGVLEWNKSRALPPGSVLRLSFLLEAQQLRDGEPVGDPQAISGTEKFEKFAGSWRFRLRGQAEAPGFFYLVDEGPDRTGTPQISVLSALPVAAGQAIGTGWYRLEGEPGTDRLWVLWARDSVKDLGSAANGSFTDAAVSARIRALLAGLPPPPRDAGGMELRGSGEIAGTVMMLDHRG